MSSTSSAAEYPPIEHHGVIGDLDTVALCGLDGSIDFLCFPKFDSPSVFASLLDEERGGSFRIEPQLGDARHRQLYLPDTNILLTRFLSEDGIAEISDFMPVVEADGVRQSIVRRVKTVQGEVSFRVTCAPRFDYGRAEHELEIDGSVARFSGADGTELELRSAHPLTNEGGDATTTFTLRAGESAVLILESPDDSGERDERDLDALAADLFKRTMNYWRSWIGNCSYHGRWSETVRRSALVLKLLTSREHGSIIAAPTFGLPENVGGNRNWDYRFTWIRDASMTASTLMRLGFDEEGEAFLRWLQQARASDGDTGPLRVLYALDGSESRAEEDLEHFSGYLGSKPVRIGNGARDQLQLDIYGELFDMLCEMDHFAKPTSHEFWDEMVEMIEWLGEHWSDKDHGIWESRVGRADFLHSRVSCWVAFDRAIELATRRSLPAPIDRWRDTRDEIFRHIYAEFWNKDLKAFVQRAGTKVADASTLFMPLTKFMAATDPRWISTLRFLENRLLDDSLMKRYDPGEDQDAGLTDKEGTFNMCSFWYVESLACSGDVDQARLVFEKMLGYANHLGLYGEETGRRGEQLGNFPQALTHLGLVRAALCLDDALARRGRAPD